MNNEGRSILFVIIGCLIWSSPMHHTTSVCAQESEGIVSATVISPPSSLTAQVTSSTQIVLGWKDNSNNETGFKIEQKSGNCSAAGSWKQIATKSSNVTSHTVSGLTPNTTYAFRVRAYQSSTNSTYSNCISAKTAASGTPPSPSNLKATSVSSTRVDLTWKDNSTNETGFKIYRKAGSGAWVLRATTGANVKSFSDTTAAGNSSTTTYQYYIAAYNASGNSASSTTATVPYQPANLTAAKGATASSIKLSWTDKSNNETGFEIYRKSGDCDSTSTWTKVASIGANKNTWTDAGCASGNTCSYKIDTYKKSGSNLFAYGYSGYSNCASAGGDSTSDIANLQSPNPQMTDGFGLSLAIDGTTIAVGGDLMGAVHVFVKDATHWTHEATLQPPASEANNRFGNTVDVSGDSIVVGSPVIGAAYVFVRTGTTWTQQAKLVASEEDTAFGHSVAISGDRLVVGSISQIPNGSACIFEREGAAWSQVARVIASDPQESDNFGDSVDISGNTILVGAPQHDDGGLDFGAAYVFTGSGTAWPQQARLTASDGAEENYFGYSVSLDGDTALVGTYGDSELALHAGAAYVFARSGAIWSQQAKIDNPEPGPENAFGFSVGLKEDKAIVGAYGAGGTAATTGSAFVFTRNPGNTWVSTRKLQAVSPAIGDFFGWSVAMVNGVYVVGAPMRDMMKGEAFVY